MEPTLSLSSAPKLYRPMRPERSPFYAVLYQFFDRFTREYEQRFERTFGPLRGIVPKTVERYFGCGLPEGGFARFRCDERMRVVGFITRPPVILKILHHIGRRFDPLKPPGRSPPLSDDFRPDPFPDYGPQ